MFWLCVLTILFSVNVIISVLVVCSDDSVHFTVSVILSVLVVCSDDFVLCECDTKCSGCVF